MEFSYRIDELMQQTMCSSQTLELSARRSKDEEMDGSLGQKNEPLNIS